MKEWLWLIGLFVFLFFWLNLVPTYAVWIIWGDIIQGLAIMISISLGNESLTHRKKGDNISSRSGSPQYGNFYLPLLTFHLHIITEIWVWWMRMVQSPYTEEQQMPSDSKYLQRLFIQGPSKMCSWTCPPWEMHRYTLQQFYKKLIFTLMYWCETLNV